MDEALFDKIAADELHRLEAALGRIAELEVDSTGDVITAEWDDGSTIVVNSHRAARQIWLSAEMSASHFAHAPASGRWVDTKRGDDLWDRLESVVSARIGRPASLGR
jgi:CyaY protein